MITLAMVNGIVPDDTDKRHVTAMATFGDSLFVVRSVEPEKFENSPRILTDERNGDDSHETFFRTVQDEQTNHSALVELYSKKTWPFLFQSRLPKTSLGPRAYGIAVCTKRKALYISDFDNNSVHVVALGAIVPDKSKPENGNRRRNRHKPSPLPKSPVAEIFWSCGRGPRDLSMTDRDSVLVACQMDSVIQEYTRSGLPTFQYKVDKVPSESDATSFLAVQVMHNDMLAVAQTDSISVWTRDGKRFQSSAEFQSSLSIRALHVIPGSSSKQKNTGDIKSCYAGTCSDDCDQRNSEGHGDGGKPEKVNSSTSREQDYLVVADSGIAESLLILDPSLTEHRRIRLQVHERPLSAITAVFVDTDGRLYVGEGCSGGRVLTFDRPVNINELFNC